LEEELTWLKIQFWKYISFFPQTFIKSLIFINLNYSNQSLCGGKNSMPKYAKKYVFLFLWLWRRIAILLNIEITMPSYAKDKIAYLALVKHKKYCKIHATNDHYFVYYDERFYDELWQTNFYSFVLFQESILCFFMWNYTL